CRSLCPLWSSRPLSGLGSFRTLMRDMLLMSGEGHVSLDRIAVDARHRLRDAGLLLWARGRGLWCSDISVAPADRGRPEDDIARDADPARGDSGASDRLHCCPRMGECGTRQ